ncbi:hypothetical protein CCM_04595 [Cordyceps militaris CM01]|uniref:Uncharacterized protein n=1 Tax=Cordyceps militaris (strain CM01) TaxID=983644 RepID=G3JG93_CORMM|nr:uncharacterized protein CCM_04595 [Cordyceps militaris CM01]EGX93223.1 hypothetical protein CCM_04595 [Cordyceps militaris CM01]
MRLTTAAAAAAVLVGSGAGLTLDVPAATNVVVVDILPHPAQITSSPYKRGDNASSSAGGGSGGFNKTCAHSVYSRAFSRSVANAELSAALRSSLSVSGASPHPWQGNLCTVTLPASLEPDYLAYLAAARSRYTSATDYLRSVHTDCGGPVFQVSVRPLCTKSSLTAVFTGGSGSSSSPKTTVLPPVPPSNGVSIDVYTGNVSMINLAANDEDSAATAASERRRSVAAVVALMVGAAVLML